MVSIVGVHGVGNFFSGRSPGEASQALAAIWLRDLGEGALGTPGEQVSVTVAYYAHHVQKPGKQSGQVTLDSLSGEAEVMVRNWLDRWGLDPGIRQGLGTMPLRQAVGVVAEHLGFARPAIETFVAVFFSEVHRYLAGNTPHRSAARADVASAIAAAPRPRAVIAHSLGSVVAYEVLTGYPHLEVDLFLTLGSPLALVFSKLDPSDGRFPPGVKRWVNVADKGDLVAVPPNGIARRFAGIEQHDDVSVHWADFHLARNYLRTDAVAEILRGYVS